MSPRACLLRALVCAILILLPIGAPVIGLVIGATCPPETGARPDDPFGFGPYAQCGVAPWLERSYQEAIFLPLVPVLLFGPIGVIVTILWITAALILPVATILYFVRAWCLTLNLHR